MFYTLLQATTAQEGGSAFMQFLPFILILVVFYFFMIRPQQKRQKELNKMRDELSKGTQIMTNGGVYGKVVEVKDNIVVVEVAEGVKVKFDKAAIATVVTENK